jgi:EAL domain-containing protein (putative c-di-GMP-specific phosphodiesterase class I)
MAIYSNYQTIHLDKTARQGSQTKMLIMVVTVQALLRNLCYRRRWNNLSMPIFNLFEHLKIKCSQRRQIFQQVTQNPLQNRYDSLCSLSNVLAIEIKNGIRNQEKTIHLEYQPKVNSQGEVIGAEALLRWSHPVYGEIPPMVVLRICEETGLTRQLNTWIINQALSDLSQWHTLGYSDMTISINLDPKQLEEDDHLIQMLQLGIAKAGIDPRYVELELTEKTVISPSHSVHSKLERMKAMGVNVSIDDFGMGHSAMMYLCDYYVNFVKLDMALIRTIVSCKKRQHLVESIISLCKKLNVKVIAEGVETKQQLDILRRLGCCYFQGFYFSKSLPVEDFIDFIAQRREIRELAN